MTSPPRFAARGDPERCELPAAGLRMGRRHADERLFAEADLSSSAPREMETPETEGVAGMPWEGFHDLLWQIYRLEGEPVDFPVESKSFTSIANAERLLGFVRSGQAVRELDILVDALFVGVFFGLLTEAG